MNWNRKKLLKAVKQINQKRDKLLKRYNIHDFSGDADKFDRAYRQAKEFLLDHYPHMDECELTQVICYAPFEYDYKGNLIK